MIGKVWDWFNGRKTVIGAALQLVADIMPFVLSALPSFGVEAAAVVAITAKSTIALGLAHKLVKWLRR